MSVNRLFYDLIAEFKRQYFGKLLMQEHLVGHQIMLNKLTYPDSGTDDTANFWGYSFLKDGKKYLLSSVNNEGEEIKLSDYLPLLASGLQKVAHRTDVYYLIRKPVIAKFKSEQTMSFKEMVDSFTSLCHSNPDHQKLMWFITLAQMMDRCNFRIATNAGFGKDSTIDIIGNLIGGAATIENPTIAKLEFMTYQKLLAINEVVDVSKPDWRNIQQFLLAAGAHKPEVTKHSRAVSNGVSEVLNISKFSISLMYNDIDHYSFKTEFFDEMTKDAVKDRFPALRLHGSFTEDFNKIKDVDIKTYVSQNMEEYKKLIYAYTYYKENLTKHLHRYHTGKLRPITSHRWRTNIGRLLKMVDLYCDTQEEFDRWLGVINASMQDYDDMLLYPDLVEKVSKRMTNEEFSVFIAGLKELPTFTERNKELVSALNGKKNYVDTTLEDVI